MGTKKNETKLPTIIKLWNILCSACNWELNSEHKPKKKSNKKVNRETCKRFFLTSHLIRFERYLNVLRLCTIAVMENVIKFVISEKIWSLCLFHSHSRRWGRSVLCSSLILCTLSLMLFCSWWWWRRLFGACFCVLLSSFYVKHTIFQAPLISTYAFTWFSIIPVLLPFISRLFNFFHSLSFPFFVVLCIIALNHIHHRSMKFTKKKHTQLTSKVCEYW